jgi:TPR repeat protein
MYQHGEGVTKDMTKAKLWIKQAYESDDAEASEAAKASWNKFELWKY